MVRVRVRVRVRSWTWRHLRWRLPLPYPYPYPYPYPSPRRLFGRRELPETTPSSETAPFKPSETTPVTRRKWFASYGATEAQ